MRPTWTKDHATAVPQFFSALAANTARLCVLVALSAFTASPLCAAASHDVRGVVKDRSGAVVARAQVTLRVAGQNFGGVTQPDGTFVFTDVKADTATIQVTAPGFATTAANWRAGEASLTITLAPATVQQSLDVTATRTSILPTGVDDVESQPDAALVSDTQLEQWGAQTIDDKLRQVPGFSLLRRSGSQTANPTSQGVSLRGLGASGASRALVLVDGIPINDPFGGWIYWARVPQASLDEVQIVPGGVSALYGNDALGGVVNLETRSAIQTAGDVEVSYGNENSPFGSGWGAMRFGQWSLSAAGEGFRTDGYIDVPKDVRGSIDTPVNVQYGSGHVRLERLFGERGRAFLDGELYGEDRQNGTPLQINDTTIRQLAFGTDYNSAQAGLFTLRLYGGTQNYHQTFSSVPLNRDSESLTDVQNVPVQQMGLIGQWSKQIASRFTMLAGLDGTYVQGVSLETTYSTGKPTADLRNGGTQESLGAFLEGIVQITPLWSVTLAAREDLWSNYDGSSVRIPVHGAPTMTDFPSRGQNAFDPRVTTSYRVSDHMVLYASGYRAFRAPTLNELYRSFRVGNVVTDANAFLRAERFSGGEAGARTTMLNNRVSIRGSVFGGIVNNPVENVTLSSTPTLITRMRQNLGETQSIGFQLGTDIRFTNRITLNAGYQFTNSIVASYPGHPALVGNLIPLVPKSIFTFQGTWLAPQRFTVAIQGLAQSNEFDDDQNLFPLGAAFVLSASVSHPLPKGFDVFFQGENLTNDKYFIAKTPTPNTGQPILVRGGFRWHSRR
jgi:outer membrane receptor protein involved in Fe transport